MASAEVLRTRGEDPSAAHIAQLLSDMRLGCGVEPAARARPLPALAQQQFGQQAQHISQPSAPVVPVAPPAHPPVNTLLRTNAHGAWSNDRPQPASQQQAPLLLSPQVTVRPPSPDSRYLTTNWAAHDEVEEELSFMMSEQAAISRDEAPRHDLSYIS